MKEKFDPAKLDRGIAHVLRHVGAAGWRWTRKPGAFQRQRYVFVKDGPHSFLANFMISFHAVEEKSDMEAYVARLEASWRVRSTSRWRRRSWRLRTATRPPRFAYDQAIQESKNVISGAPFGAGRGFAVVGGREDQDQGAAVDGGKVDGG